MKKCVLACLCIFSGVLSVHAQIDLLGLSDSIAGAVQSSFPGSVLRDQAVSQIRPAIGNNGNASVFGTDANGFLVGNGVAGSTTASANINIGEGIATSVTWTTTISWQAYKFTDGFVHVKVKVSWGSSAAGYEREIDVATSMPNAVADVGGRAAEPVLHTGLWGDSASTGHYELVGVPAQYMYFTPDGGGHVVGYTQWIWVWVPADRQEQQCQE